MVMGQGTPFPIFATGQPLSQNPVGTSTLFPSSWMFSLGYVLFLQTSRGWGLAP